MENIFERYNSEVLILWNKVGLEFEAGLSKKAAIKLNESTKRNVISATQIHGLYSALDHNDCWREQVGSNWEWRGSTPPASQERTYKSDEVKLERAIAYIAPIVWTCQMSTSSGTQGKLHRRRAIDLVRHNGNKSFAFIELKIDSDNPLYASFEILGYALAYLHARMNNWEGRGPHDVMDAQKIELTVLGPISWYQYKKRGQSPNRKFQFDWLAQEIASALNNFVRDDLHLGDLQFAFEFRPIEIQTGVEIDRLARETWWQAPIT